MCLAVLFAGCITHHHHYPPPEGTSAQESPRPSAPQGRVADESTPEPAQEPFYVEAAPAPPAEETQPARADDPPAPPAESSGQNPCELTTFRTGWTEGQCEDLTLYVQSGPAARTEGSYRRSFAIEYAAGKAGRGIFAFGDEARRETINGQELEVSRVTLRRAEEKLSFAGTNYLPDAQGQIVYEGVYGEGRSDRGDLGMLCLQDEAVDRRRCLALFAQLIEAPETYLGESLAATVDVLGVELPMGRNCHFNRPTEVLCVMKGSLQWHRGDVRQVRRVIDEQIAAWTDDNGIDGFYNPHDEYDCEIGGHRATCHEVAYQGVTDSPSRILYAAVVERGHDSVHLSCDVGIDDQMSQPCQAIFGRP